MIFCKLNGVIIISLIMIFLMSMVGIASAYQLFLSCPESVQIGTTLKCSIDTNFPAGTIFHVVMYPPGYTTTPVHNQTVTIQENHATQYRIFDTTGLLGGQYRVEIQFIGPDEDRLSSDSVILQLPLLVETLIANFSSLTRTGIAPLTVQFSDNSTGSPDGWAWYFGDESYSQAWMQITPSAEWSGRMLHSSVALPDGSIVLMGGVMGGAQVWRLTDLGATWTEVNSTPGWSERFGHTSVALPDSSIVLMGGNGYTNDVWRSMDYGATWTEVNSSAGWPGRGYHSSIVLADGSILLMGGNSISPNLGKNDVWRSTDNGSTWMQMTANAGWTARFGHSSVVMPDGSIVLMGGSNGTYYHDVWRSTDNGTTWTQMTASAGWSARCHHSSVVMPDGSIILMGGYDGTIYNDTWRSTDNGRTWTQVNASVGWIARYGHSSVVMPDGSIVLTGGCDTTFPDENDVWRLIPTGSSVQNPVHTYTAPGTYQVALQVYNSKGYNSTRKVGSIIVTSPIGVFRPSTRQFIFNTVPVTRTTFGLSTDVPITGDWDGDAKTDIGVFRPSTRQFIFNTSPVTRSAFGLSTDVPITGDWNNDGKTDVGVFRPSTRQFIFNTVPVTRTTFGFSTDIPITGDWDGDAKTDIGVFRPSTRQFIFNTSPVTRTTFGFSTDISITGDWNNDGKTDVGVFRPSTRQFIFNTSPITRTNFGLSSDIPITGKWI